MHKQSFERRSVQKGHWAMVKKCSNEEDEGSKDDAEAMLRKEECVQA